MMMYLGNGKIVIRMEGMNKFVIKCPKSNKPILGCIKCIWFNPELEVCGHKSIKNSILWLDDTPNDMRIDV